MEIPRDTQTYANDSATSSAARTKSTQPGSSPVLFELIGPNGEFGGLFKRAGDAMAVAKEGWTVQAIGASVVHQRHPMGPVKVEAE